MDMGESVLFGCLIAYSTAKWHRIIVQTWSQLVSHSTPKAFQPCPDQLRVALRPEFGNHRGRFPALLNKRQCLAFHAESLGRLHTVQGRVQCCY